jgi:multidrug efflux pump subunit AcrA (membrane-fusion protein)
MNLKLLILLLIIIIFSCQKSESPSKGTADLQLGIKTAPVVRMDMVDTLHIYGEVKLRQESLLASQFDGRLTEFSLLLGDRVRKNDRIGIIIPPQREALLHVMNQIDVTMRPMLEQEIKSIPLVSPLDGVVMEVRHHNGDVLQKGEPFVHIGDLRQLDVYGDLPLRALPSVKKLRSITVLFLDYPHAPILLPIEAIGSNVHKAKQTVTIRLGLENQSGEFRPGMQVELIFPGNVHKSTMVIPRAALLEEEGIYSAFVVKGNKVEKRYIVPGILKNDRVEVCSGLTEGEFVATDKSYSLIDGMEVIVE